MIGFILTTSWDDKKKHPLCIYVKTQSEVVKIITNQQKPLFFVKQQDKLPPGIRNIDRKELELTTMHNDKMSAVYFKTQADARDAKKKLEENGIRSFEADVQPQNRYLMERFIHSSLKFEGESIIENGMKVFINPVVEKSNFSPTLSSLSVDIETSIQGDLYSIAQSFHVNNTVKTIVHIIGDETDRGGVIFVKDEKELLHNFIRSFNEYDADLILGWHVAGFDFKLLEQKCMKYSMDLALGRDKSKLILNSRDNRNYFAKIEGRVVLDGPPLLRSNFFKYTNYKLDTVANELLGTGKDIEQTGLEKVAEITRRFNEDKMALAKYNIMDCTLVYDIYKKLDIFNLLINRSLITGLTIDRVGGSSAAFDHFYLPRLHRKGFIAPNVMDIEQGESSTGGLVLEPVAGFHENVAVFDFKSLYPSIMRTFSIDPLALERGENLVTTPMGVKFSKDHNILSPYLAELLELRTRAKSDFNTPLSHAIKILMNSFYGVLGSYGCRFYHADLPSAITKSGHWILNQSKDFFQNLGLEVIYGDTDSLFVKVNDTDNGAIQKIADDLNFYMKRIILDEFKVESHLEVEFEKLYSNLFFSSVRGADHGAKKRYVGQYMGELDFVGMEYVRSDWTEFAKQFQYSLYEKVFAGDNVELFIKDQIKDLETGVFNNQLRYNKRFSKPISEYTKTNPPHVKAARLLPLEKQEGLRDIQYIVTMNGPKPVEMFTSSDKVDYSHYIDKQLRPIADSVLRFIDLDFESIACGNQLTLF